MAKPKPPIDIFGDPDARVVGVGKMYRVDRFILHSTQWSAFKSPLPAAPIWSKVPFTTQGIGTLPKTDHGIYTFVAGPNIASHPGLSYLLYVGKADDMSLRSRVRSYLGEDKKKKPRQHILQMVKNWRSNLWVYYAIVSNKLLVEPFEESLLEALIPPFNRVFPATIKKWVSGVFS